MMMSCWATPIDGIIENHHLTVCLFFVSVLLQHLAMPGASYQLQGRNSLVMKFSSFSELIDRKWGCWFLLIVESVECTKEIPKSDLACGEVAEVFIGESQSLRNARGQGCKSAGMHLQCSWMLQQLSPNNLKLLPSSLALKKQQLAYYANMPA